MERDLYKTTLAKVGIISIVDYIKGYEEILICKLLYLTLAFAIGSIVIKAWMYFYTLHAANKINSTGLKADAFHHLSDSLSSIASALGIIGLIIGGIWTILDSIASIIIALFIIKVSIDICELLGK